MRFDLIFTLRDIYINFNPNPLAKFSSSSRGTELRDILPWNISQMIMKIISISMKIINEMGHPVKFDRKSMETETAA